ncbi:MAG: helix-turn-helix transcriptional regulator [Pirellulaceae bacterium]|jgi:transcriptional regulator with XRE-family HTH domain
MSRKLPTTRETPLQRARTQRGLKQSDVATALGLTQGWYSKIERGETTPDVLLAQRIANHFKTNVSDLWPEAAAEVRT